MQEKFPCVYLLASKPGGVLYLGVTSDIVKRVWQHKSDFVDGFSKKYKVHDLVWFETHLGMESAILREKRIKKWRRAWRVALIEEFNPGWRDLYGEIIG